MVTGRIECRVQRHAHALGVLCAGLEQLGREAREIERLALVQSALGAGQREQRLDQALLLLARREHAPVAHAQRVGRRIGIVERDLGDGAGACERRPQLVRGVRDELALGGERRLEAPEQLVERVRELAELVVGAFEREATVQAVRRDLPRALVDRAQRAQHPARGEPADADREGGHDREGEARLLEQLMQLGGVLLLGDLAIVRDLRPHRLRRERRQGGRSRRPRRPRRASLQRARRRADHAGTDRGRRTRRCVRIMNEPPPGFVPTRTLPVACRTST